jgi:hypothetical protein
MTSHQEELRFHHLDGDHATSVAGCTLCLEEILNHSRMNEPKFCTGYGCSCIEHEPIDPTGIIPPSPARADYETRMYQGAARNNPADVALAGALKLLAKGGGK